VSPRDPPLDVLARGSHVRLAAVEERRGRARCRPPNGRDDEVAGREIGSVRVRDDADRLVAQHEVVRPLRVAAVPPGDHLVVGSVDPDAKDPEPKRVLMRRLTQDAEFEALLLRCQQEIQRWYEGEPWYPDAMKPDEVREQMKKAAEPVFDFAATCLKDVDDEDAWLRKDEVRKCYREYATEEGLPKMGKEQFGERLLNLTDFSIEVVPTRQGWPARLAFSISSTMASYFSCGVR